MTAPDLARELGLNPKWLRQLIRDHRLVPTHRRGERYELDDDDVARIKNHPAIRQAVMNRSIEEPGEAPGHEPEEAREVAGPHGWTNWYAANHGYPRRRDAHPDSVIIHPLWEEFAFYSDARIGGASRLAVGPFEFIVPDSNRGGQLGSAHKALIFRWWDHIPDIPIRTDRRRHRPHAYHGGDIGDEFAALLALALGRRMRSGGPVRTGLPIDALPLGLPSEVQHVEPVLVPPHRLPMIAGLAVEASLSSIEPILRQYAELPSPAAGAVIRAASQYADGLWLADADPRLAWIKLFGALEVAANYHDSARFDTPVDQLRHHRKRLLNKIRGAPAYVIDAVAAETAHTFNVQRKMLSFVEEFAPPPPPRRPDSAQVDWDHLTDALSVLYDHRSRDLHDGVAFPWALCEPPDVAGMQIAPERFWAIDVSGRGGLWTADELPMYLHVFAYLVGETLRTWLTHLTPSLASKAGSEEDAQA